MNEACDSAKVIELFKVGKGLNYFRHLRLATHKYNSGTLPEAFVYRPPPQARILIAKAYIWRAPGICGGTGTGFEI